LNLSDFDYELPEASIAQKPCEQRDGSRLMVIDRASGRVEHRHFYDLPSYLRAGDVLVFNDSRVIPARLFGEKQGTGAKIELLLIHPLSGHEISDLEWLVLAKPARRLKVGDRVAIAPGFSAVITAKHDDGSLDAVFETELGMLADLHSNGTMPLPPYIKRTAEAADSERYQTVYASDPGSVAAPTAGLHFTPDILQQCSARGVQLAKLTLHVGLGTFRAVQESQIEQHQMHEEWYRVGQGTAVAINAAKQEGRRVICVGTTSVRSLESAAQAASGTGSKGRATGIVRPGWQKTDIFIYPGYQFKITDAMITNFHLPKSTLLMLVSAFYDREKILSAYSQAVTEGYRFFSYGDAMLIL